MIRVLVVDDSAFMRIAISDMLNKAEDIEVIGTAKDGIEAIKKVKELRPDVVILDIQMPRMDGLTALEVIMKECPTPVIMFSALTKEGARETLEALKLGAVDFVAKPWKSISYDLSAVESELLSKIRAAKYSNPQIIRLQNLKRFRQGVVKGNWNVAKKDLCVLIGASTGGPSAIEQVITRLPSDFPAPIFIVQHMPKGSFTEQFASRLDAQSEITVKEAENNEKIKKGVAYVAPGGYHMKVRFSLGIKRIKITDEPPVNAVKPSVDVTAYSLPQAYGKNMVGVILTGMGEDGARGLKKIKDAGGKTIACSADTCVVFGMPKAAIEMGAVDSVKPLYEIPEEIVKFVEVILNERPDN